MYALSGLRQWYEDARTFADSIAAETVSVLENSLNSRIRTLTSQIMESLANQEPLGAILEEEASLLAIIKSNDTDADLHRRAVYGLYLLTNNPHWLRTSKTAFERESLPTLLDLLDSSDMSVRSWTCCILGNLARSRNPKAILSPEPCARLLSCEWAIIIFSDEKNGTELAHSAASGGTSDTGQDMHWMKSRDGPMVHQQSLMQSGRVDVRNGRVFIVFRISIVCRFALCGRVDVKHGRVVVCHA
ncbi:hypothetical protein B0H16DRAFT_783397 [Mycena metata]|uniref:Uncharacterized protein n=1 Tax=Mycena metata TaxID=1033252 RepID=A0AAD7J011_9AGAR|nr:hypothetical protein B0H16DRAFT_783397 [Mycena metata]